MTVTIMLAIFCFKFGNWDSSQPEAFWIMITKPDVVEVEVEQTHEVLESVLVMMNDE